MRLAPGAPPWRHEGGGPTHNSSEHCTRVCGALRGDSGTATAETAIVIGVVSALLLVILGVGSLVVENVQLNDGARTVARDVMRGVDESSAIAHGTEVTGGEATFRVSRRGEWVEVEAIQRESLAGPLLSHEFTLTAVARTRLEPHLVGGGSP